jgi:putative nucleotidyltransferase with HDIG domain
MKAESWAESLPGDLNPEMVVDLKKWFFDYVRTFECKDKEIQSGIRLKKKHSIRVVNEIRHIGRQLNLSERDVRLAEVVAILHDVGRFEQYQRYRTFADPLSLNHAQLGARTVQESGVIRRWPDSLQEVVVYAISHHSLAELPSNGARAHVFFSRLLRDADKLDILKLVTRYFLPARDRTKRSFEAGLPDTPGVSEQVQDDLTQERVVDVEHVRNLNDQILFRLGWIYDINFHPTLRRIREKRYVEMIRCSLPNSPEIDEIFHAVRSFMGKKLSEQRTGIPG